MSEPSEHQRLAWEYADVTWDEEGGFELRVPFHEPVPGRYANSIAADVSDALARQARIDTRVYVVSGALLVDSPALLQADAQQVRRVITEAVDAAAETMNAAIVQENGRIEAWLDALQG